ncbi:MAG: GTP cyclohydrolase I [Deltaproteobacteria bacterium]
MPDIALATRALADLLASIGAPLDDDPEIRDTPARAARMYMEELLDGYAAEPADVLRDGVASSEPGLVVLTGARYVSMCPHHLMPSMGRAAIGYVPSGRVVGLGTLVKLLEVYAHRLILQEALGQRVADALVAHLGARGAAVHLRARHLCLSARGEKQTAAAVVSVAYAGDMPESDRAAFVAAVAGRPRRAR